MAGFSRARIDRVRANDFTLKTQFSPQTVSIPPLMLLAVLTGWDGR
jgi:hypothetical protein